MKEGKGDVVSLGEVMVRLAPEPGVRLEDAGHLNVEIGGTECNVLVALSSLGRSCAWISKLSKGELGSLVYRRVRRTGVDLSRVVWSDSRAGVYFVELGRTPRATKVIYDRRDSAASKLDPDDIDWDFVGGFSMLHLSGITPALSDTCLETAKRAIAFARDLEIPVSFDLNYRSKLWRPEQARAVLEPMVQDVEILITTRSDAELVLGASGAPKDVVSELHSRYGTSVTVVTLGGEGAVAATDDRDYAVGGHPVEEIDRIGAGDAFTAGFLHGYLDGDIQRGLDLGSAMAALKHTIVGDFLETSPEEVEDIIAGGRGVSR